VEIYASGQVFLQLLFSLSFGWRLPALRLHAGTTPKIGRLVQLPSCRFFPDQECRRRSDL